jgi:hypothetical protein
LLPVSFTLELFLEPELLLKVNQKITHLTHAMKVVRAADYIIRGPMKRSDKVWGSRIQPPKISLVVSPSNR